MRTTRTLWTGITVILIAATRGLAAWADNLPAIKAQGTRRFTPTGFEFGVTTPVLKYQFPREKYKATTFKGTWIAENTQEVRPNFEIDTAEAKPGADGVLVHTERFVIQ